VLRASANQANTPFAAGANRKCVPLGGLIDHGANEEERQNAQSGLFADLADAGSQRAGSYKFAAMIGPKD
jgi:hypothetical protein